MHGSVIVSKAGAGGRLEVELIAKGASIAKAGRSSAKVRVGRSAHSSLKAGKVTFTVALDAAAKKALKRHHSLALTVKITLTPTHGKATVLTHGVVMHA